MRNAGLHALRRAGVVAGLLALVAAAAATAASGTSIGTHHTKKGKIVANVHGFSLYMFKKDKRFGSSTCYGQCAVIWPPVLTTGRPHAIGGSGVNSKLLGTKRRKDGKLQVTYNGWLLYLYQPDRKAGQINGEGANQFGAPWYLMNTAGKIVKPCPPGFVMSSNGCVSGSY